MHRITTIAQCLILTLLVITQSACVAVTYSSGGGWSVWPGGIGLFVMLGVVMLIVGALFRR